MEKEYTQQEAEGIRKLSFDIAVALDELVKKLGLTETSGFIQQAYTNSNISDIYHDFIKWNNALHTLTPQGKYEASTLIKL